MGETTFLSSEVNNLKISASERRLTPPISYDMIKVLTLIDNLTSNVRGKLETNKIF